MFLVGGISFVIGAVVAALVMYVYFVKREMTLKEDFSQLKTKAELTQSLQDIIKRDFVQLAQETIKNEQEDLRKQNREVLEEKIAPLKNELGEFKNKVEKFNLSGVENAAKIEQQILNLEKNNKIIAQEAKNLTEALTKNQNIKGAYGENILDTILESCGMQEGIHYSKQFVTTSSNLKDGEIHTIRPDIVINLPKDRHIIIDSKVTLTSYLDCIEDESKVKDFKAEVKKRIVDLANKNYQNAENLWQPDFVLMYIPIEASLNLIYEDYELINSAYKSKIIIVGTASLLTTIKLVDQLFAQQKQCESVNNIVTAGTNLYETFVQFCEDLVDLQKRFDEINKKFGTTINRFKRKNKNRLGLFEQVKELKQLGITSSKEIPDTLLEVDDNIDELEGVLAND